MKNYAIYFTFVKFTNKKFLKIFCKEKKCLIKLDS